MDGKTKLGNAAVARRLNMQTHTWTAYVARGHAPQPDGREEISNTPWWYASTVDAWFSSRPGQGARTDLPARSDRS